MSKLDEFRKDASTKKTSPKDERITTFAKGGIGWAALDILAFDQSLANTGWVYITRGRVVDQGLIKTEERDDLRGIEADLVRSYDLGQPIGNLFARWSGEYTVLQPVLELPAVKGKGRITSSLLAAAAVVQMAHRQGVKRPHFVNAQRAKKLVTGNVNATKAEVKEAMAAMLPDLSLPGRTFNQHISDAAAVAAVAARELEPEALATHEKLFGKPYDDQTDDQPIPWVKGETKPWESHDQA
jgi:Holliday junction resolvasome RuvABC endonuclease subunit